MDAALQYVLGRNVRCFIDDIVICANTVEEILKWLQKVLEACKKAGFYLRLDKCEWLRSEVNFLGQVVGKGGVRVQPQKQRNVQESKRPMNKKELQSFVGVAGYVRPYVPRYSEYAAPLYQLLKKGKDYEWTADVEKAY